MTFPPVDFPLYGLAADLQLPGRLWNVEGKLGAPTWALWWWFGRVAEPTHGEAWVQVGCLPRERHAEVMTPRGGDPVREVAFAAAFALTNATLPSETERPDGYLDEVVDFAGRLADGYERWTSVTWRVDGRAVPARLVRWAGAWAGFTTAAAVVDPGGGRSRPRWSSPVAGRAGRHVGPPPTETSSRAPSPTADPARSSSPHPRTGCGELSVPEGWSSVRWCGQRSDSVRSEPSSAKATQASLSPESGSAVWVRPM